VVVGPRRALLFGDLFLVWFGLLMGVGCWQRQVSRVALSLPKTQPALRPPLPQPLERKINTLR
jgi:hypothetical protein